MKRKEKKNFIKEFNSLKNKSQKIEMIENLFHFWTKEFEATSKKSRSEIIGFVQRANSWWKDICGLLNPVYDDYYLTDYSWADFFFSNARELYRGTYGIPNLAIMIVDCGLDIDLMYEGLETITVSITAPDHEKILIATRDLVFDTKFKGRF